MSEHVATVRSVTNRKSSLFDIVIHDNQALHPGTKLFIHAGHSDEEIERLNVLIRGSRASLDTCALQIESLQAQLVDSQAHAARLNAEAERHAQNLNKATKLFMECFASNFTWPTDLEERIDLFLETLESRH